MSQYSISDLEQLIGVKAHTIRIWEQRYGLVVPCRTETNIRYYTEEDKCTLMQVALLNKKGIKISKIACLTPEEIQEKVATLDAQTKAQTCQIEALTMAMLQMHEIEAESIFTRFMAIHGFEDTMSKLIFPFLDKLNVLWLTGSIQPVHERFISNLIKRKTILAIEQHSVQTNTQKPLFLLFLREGESQELTLLYMHYLLRARGFPVINLGGGVTLTDIATTCNLSKPKFVFSVFNEPLHRQSFQSYLDGLSKSIQDSRMLITGHQIFSQHLQFSTQFVIIEGLNRAIDILNELEKT